MLTRNHRGFTLVELLIVITTLGILVAVTAPAVTRSFMGNSQALSYETTFQKLNTSWLVLLLSTDTGYSTANTPLLANSANSVLDILVLGNNPAGVVASGYLTEFEKSGIRRASYIRTDTAPAVGTPGTYSFDGHAITYSVDSTGIATMTFANVQTSEVERLHEKHSGTTFTPGTANVTGPVQWTAVSGGTHTLTLQTMM